MPSRNWPNGSTTRWRKTRQQVLERDRHRCMLRIPGICTEIATHVHHTESRSLVGDNPDYLVAACAPCNWHTGDPQAATGNHPARDPAPKTPTTW